VERELGSVIVGLLRRDDRRVGDIPLSYPPERVSHEGPAALELGLVVQVLKLTAAAIVPDVMGTARLHPSRRSLEQFTHSRSGKLLVLS